MLFVLIHALEGGIKREILQPRIILFHSRGNCADGQPAGSMRYFCYDFFMTSLGAETEDLLPPSATFQSRVRPP